MFAGAVQPSMRKVRLLIAPGFSAYKPRSNRPASDGLPWRFLTLAYANNNAALAPQESKMPKLKTKSGAKKRFKITGTGKVVYAQRGKRHGMIKRTKKQIRNLRGTSVMFKTDGDNVKKYFLPNG